MSPDGCGTLPAPPARRAHRTQRHLDTTDEQPARLTKTENGHRPHADTGQARRPRDRRRHRRVQADQRIGPLASDNVFVEKLVNRNCSGSFAAAQAIVAAGGPVTLS